MQIWTHNSLNVVLMNYLLENNYLEKDEDNFALFLAHCAIYVCTIPGGVFFLLILKCSIIDPNWKEEGSFLTSRQKQKKVVQNALSTF